MSTTTTAPPPHAREATPLQPGAGARGTRSLGSYIALGSEQRREVVSLQRPDGSTLVVDYQLGALSDGRLIAHLAADEPPENAHIVCELYLADDTKGRCRAVTQEDFDLTRHATPPPPAADAPTAVDSLKDADGHVYRIRELPTLETMPELRWTRSASQAASSASTPCIPRCRRRCRSLRAGANPHRPGAHPLRQDLSTRRLAEEHERLSGSPIVLNRGLREAVQRVLRDELSMSEIAHPLRADQARQARQPERGDELAGAPHRPAAGGEGRPTWSQRQLALIARMASAWRRTRWSFDHHAERSNAAAGSQPAHASGLDCGHLKSPEAIDWLADVHSTSPASTRSTSVPARSLSSGHSAGTSS